MTDHARFEALAGAVMLGEATQDERARFADHAAACAACREDAAAMPAFRRTLERARDAETWRPSVDAAVGRRIRASRGSRFRVTIGVLGWAVALSIVLNVAFVSGLSGRLHDAFDGDDAVVSSVPAMKIELESKVASVPAVDAARVSSATAPVANRRLGPSRSHVRIARRSVARPVKVPDEQELPPAPGAADVPDVLAGLGVDGSSSNAAKHVAVRPPCEGTASAGDPAAGDTPPEPCAAATELHH